MFYIVVTERQDAFRPCNRFRTALAVLHVATERWRSDDLAAPATKQSDVSKKPNLLVKNHGSRILITQYVSY